MATEQGCLLSNGLIVLDLHAELGGGLQDPEMEPLKLMKKPPARSMLSSLRQLARCRKIKRSVRDRKSR